MNAREALDQFALFADQNGAPGNWEDWDITIRNALDQLADLKVAAKVIARRQIILSIVADRPFAFCHDCGLYTFNPKENDPPHTDHCPTGTVLRIIEEGGEESA